MQSETRTCQNCKQDFRIDTEDFAFYEKMKVPAPTWCPECRMIRRMVWRSDRFLFRVPDAVTGKEIFSGMSPRIPVKIYEKEYWWSDAWEPMDYGRDYDFSRPFFEQFRDLMYAVPWPSRNIKDLVDSDYSNNGANLKNCYLCFNLDAAENSAYIIDTFQIKECFDITSTTTAELCYDGVAVKDCFKAFYSYTCQQCRDTWFSRDCIGCSFIFGCANLRNKQYYIFNKPYTKEGYFEELARILQDGSYLALESAREKAYEVWRSHPYKYMISWNNVNVTGDWVVHSKNVKNCFNVVEVEDSKYCDDTARAVRDSYDATALGEASELTYDLVGAWWGCRNVKFSFNVWPAVAYADYSVNCHSSTNIFGCMGLRNKSYCIFNKQYTPEEYKIMRDKIIRHMNDMPYTDSMGRIYRYGEFFPPEFSPFAYNETIANDFFPMTPEDARAQGFLWREPEMREFQTTVDAQNLPDRIGDAQDSILKEIIKCMSCGKAYRIIQMELEFLRDMFLPLPHRCPECRYLARFSQRNQPRLYADSCRCKGEGSGMYRNGTAHPHGIVPCGNTFETSFAPGRPEIIYCEQCYNAEVA